MNFTREPIIETVVTPREGCKLVVRNSKGNGQEEYFVDAVEVVSFGHSLFFRSLEKPKSFLVPVSDYEVLELRETRMILKHVPSDRSMKISSGREQPARGTKESQFDQRQLDKDVLEENTGEELPALAQEAGQVASEPRLNDRKRKRRRRGRTDRALDTATTPTTPREEGSELAEELELENQEESPENKEEKIEPLEESVENKTITPPSLLSRLFSPPRFLAPPPIIRRPTPKLPEVSPLPTEEVKHLEAANQQEEQSLFLDPSETEEPNNSHLESEE